MLISEQVFLLLTTDKGGAEPWVSSYRRFALGAAALADLALLGAIEISPDRRGKVTPLPLVQPLPTPLLRHAHELIQRKPGRRAYHWITDTRFGRIDYAAASLVQQGILEERSRGSCSSSGRTTRCGTGPSSSVCAGASTRSTGGRLTKRSTRALRSSLSTQSQPPPTYSKTKRATWPGRTGSACSMRSTTRWRRPNSTARRPRSRRPSAAPTTRLSPSSGRPSMPRDPS
ncbi:GPP34 family phosphoprotein [Corynebacterium aquatimens]|nr:GPP34 family phosphoprotein [Corynebacterium aquatimens]